MRKGITVGFAFFTTFCVFSAASEEITNVVVSDSPAAQPVRDCGISLRKLLASSNQYMIAHMHPRPEDLDFLIEEHDDRKGVEFIEIFNKREAKNDSSPGAGHYGWVVYHPDTGELWDESADPDHPVKLTWDASAAQEYRSCRAVDEQCFQAVRNINDDPTIGFYPNAFDVAGDASERYVKNSESRQPFYWAPNKNCAVRAFVVNNDKIQALSWGQNNGFVWSRYINPATQKITEGWLPQEALVTRQQICDEARHKAGTENLSAEEMVTREVKNKRQRLYFYNAPNKACLREENAFVVDGDRVQMLNKPAFAGYRFIRYTHPTSQKVTEGWVSSEGLSLP